MGSYGANPNFVFLTDYGFTVETNTQKVGGKCQDSVTVKLSLQTGKTGKSNDKLLDSAQHFFLDNSKQTFALFIP
jgi:hypothetical protein